MAVTAAPTWWPPPTTAATARRHVEAEARIVLPGDPDYARLLAMMNQVNRNRYDLYRAKTARPIPVAVLRATEGGADASAVSASGRAGAR